MRGEMLGMLSGSMLAAIYLVALAIGCSAAPVGPCATGETIGKPDAPPDEPVPAPAVPPPVVPAVVVDPAPDVVRASYGYRNERRIVGYTRAIRPRNRQPIYGEVRVWDGPPGTEPPLAATPGTGRVCGPRGCR